MGFSWGNKHVKISVRTSWGIPYEILHGFSLQIDASFIIQTPWRLIGISCGILHGITIDHDVFYGNSTRAKTYVNSVETS